MENKDIKVLVVDDENDFRKLLTFWLRSKGYTIIEAENGKQAVTRVKEDNPDIVFMDLNMPQMSGSEAIKEIRAFNKDVPVIVISSYIDDRKAKDAREAGISGVFYKGKDFEEGLSLLEAALRTHRQLKK
jgi:CheY-like chemotaxis protein